MAKIVKSNRTAIIIITVIFVILLLIFIIIIIYAKVKSKWVYATYTPPKLSNGYYPGGGTMSEEQLAAFKAALSKAVASSTT